MRPTKENYDIADWAIAGNRLPIVGDALWFYNPYDKPCRSYFPSRVGSSWRKLDSIASMLRQMRIMKLE